MRKRENCLDSNKRLKRGGKERKDSARKMRSVKQDLLSSVDKRN